MEIKKEIISSVKCLFTVAFFLFFIGSYAQTCDENVLKGLENTRIYYHKEVTKGSNASFFIKNPLKGTTYSFIDKATGVAYSKLYTGVPEELTIEIPVGKVDDNRKFYLKAENGACTFSKPNHFNFEKSILPDKGTTPKLSLSVEEEWCTNAGAIHINIVNGSTGDYKFFAKKGNGAFVELSQPDYTSLSAGYYTIKAVHKTTNKELQSVSVNIRNEVKPVKFSLKAIPDACSGRQVIYVDTTKDENGRNVTNTAPLFFTLYDKNNAIVRPAQLSPIFSNLSPDEYSVRVNDNCGTGTGGNALTRPINLSATLSALNIEKILYFTAKAGCPYMKEINISFAAKNIENIIKANTFTYPIEFDLQIESPTGRIYPIHISANNKEEFTEYFWGDGDQLKLISQKVIQNKIPAEAGKWKVKGTYTLCGRVHNLNEKESDTVYLPLDQVYIMDSNLPNATGCRTKRMVLSANDQALLRNYYVILEEAPAGFDYEAAGFYKINSTNPLLQNKWVKFFPDTSSQTLLNPEFITEGFTYKFKIVDECSGKTRELTRPGYKSTANLEVDYKVYASCTDNNGNPDPTALWKNVIFQKRTYTSSLSKVEILSYTRNSAYPDYKSLVPVTLPFTLTDAYKTGQERWEIKLPPGDYKVRYTDACNLTEERKIEVRGTDNTELKWEEQNCQTTVSIIRNTAAYAPSGIVYIIEIYNPKEQVWEPLKTPGESKTVLTLDNTNNHRFTFFQGGKLRVIRAISRDQGATIDCPRVVEEREISRGEMRVPTITRLDCSAVGGAQKYHIVITPQGGTPPYSYVLKSKEEDQIVGGVTSKVTTVIDKANGNNNFFINIDESNASARYKFIVKDACNVEKSIDETLSNIQPFKIEKNQQFYCLNAKGILSLPKIEGLTYAWYRKDNPANILSTSNQLVIEHLTQDDLDKEFAVKLTLTNVTDPLVKNCIESNLSGMDSIRFNAVPTISQSYQAPTPHDMEVCIVPNSNMTEYNVNQLFSNVPTTPQTGVYTEIVDKAGLISVSKEGKINLDATHIGKHTFVYRIKTDCGVLKEAEATLDVRAYSTFGDFKIEVCAPTLTFDELQKLGQKAYPAWFILAKPEQYLFEWYATESDARNRTNKLTATSVTLSEGETKQYYLRIRINNEKSCFTPVPSSYKLTRIATGAKPNKTVTLCKGATVGELKQNIDKNNQEKIVIYNGNQKLTDDYVLQVGTPYTYTYLVGTCETAPANITLTLSERSVAAIETFVTCEYERDWRGLGVPYRKVEDYLKDKYGATTIIKIYSQAFQGALNGNSLMYLGSEEYTFTVEAAGKCVSNLYPIRVYADTSLANFTVAQKTQVLCSGTNQTIASLQPQGTNIVWYATATATTPLAKTTPLVAGTTYYVAQKNGTCESDRVAVAVTQGASGNETLVFSTPFSKTLKCVPSGQLRFQVQNAVAGQSYVVELTEVPAGYTGSRTFTITKDNKEGNVPFVWLTQNNVPKGTYKARLVKCGVSQEIGQTITELTSNFPIRDNFDAGPYVDINDCNYANLRNSQARAGGIDINAYFQNEAIAKQFFEYTAVSPQDMTDKGWTNASQIPDSYWREVYSLPAGITSSQPKVIYYDLAAFGRNYADLAIANKKPKFYFRIKGQPSCGVSAPIEFGDTRMLTMKMAYGGSCTAPTIKISLDRTVIVCKPITYEVKNEAGQVVASGSTNVANAIIDITNLNGNPINPNEKYSVTVKAAAPDTQSVTTIARSFNQAKAAYRPDGQYAEIKRCFGHPERTEMYIQGFLRDENGVLLSLKGYKVTLESAPAGYANEPNKLKVGESYTITRDASSYNLLSTLNVQNAAGFSSLPEGDYKIKIEDPCGQTYYVENGRRKKANILTIEHPQYSEKPLTPEKEVACTGVKVYPFKGNTAQDWLKKNNQNQNLYVWLVKIPTGVNAADISTTPQQPGTYAGNTYQRAIYSSDNAATLDTYFTLPRNENSTGVYTFAYAEDEREIYNYIANSPTACVRTFEVKVDDVLLNFDPNTYIGYHCDNNMGKIVIKAVNGVNDSGQYTYALYDTKEGNLIESKTAAKGTEVTFTNLGTFATGQNTRWVKITDSTCPATPMWRELPIADASQANLLLKNPLRASYCQGESVSIELRPIGATKYVWTLPDGSSQETTEPKLDIASLQATHSGTYAVKAEGLTCGANTLTFSYNINVLQKPTGGQTYTFCQGAKISDLKTQVDTNTNLVKVYKNNTLVTDDNELLTSTDTYTVSRFSTTCETDKVGVTVSLTQLAKPIVTTEAATCTAPSKAKITNYQAGLTYWEGGTQLTVAADGVITTPLTPGNHIVTARNAAGCASVASDAFTVIAQLPLPTASDVFSITEQPQDGVTCQGTNYTLTSKVELKAPYTGNITYQWEFSTNNGGSWSLLGAQGTLTSGGTATIVHSIASGSTNKYRVKYTYQVPSCGNTVTVLSDIATLSIRTLWISAHPQASTSYCKGVTPTALSVSTNGTDTGITYQWYKNTSNNPSGATLITGATQQTYTPATDTVGTTYYFVEVKGQGCQRAVRSALAQVKVIQTQDPTVTEKSAASCTAVSVAQVSNHVAGTVYTITDSAGTTVSGVSVAADGTINGLTSAGTYKIKATKDGCSSSEVSFTITAQVATPSSPTVTTLTECPTLASTQFDMATLVTASAGHTLKWYDAATGGTALAASPKVERQVTAKSVTTKYVSQEKDGCESARVAVTYTVDDIVDPSLTADDIVLDCTAANFDTLVTTWLTTTAATATDTCTTPVVTNNYSKPTDLCGAGEIEVTFTAKDSFGNQTQKKAKIRFIVAKDDDYTATPVTPSATEQVVKDGSGTPYNVLNNDKLYGNGATTSNVTISEVTPNANVKIDTTTGQVKVQSNTPVGTYTVTYRICDKNTPTACSNVATVTVKVVPATPTIEAKDDPDTNIPRTGGSIDILSNDKLNGGQATKDNVNITIDNNGGLTTVMIDPTTGKLVVPNNSTPGTYTVTYKICDKANPTVCDTAKVKIIIAPGTIHNIEAVDDGVWEVGTQGEFLTPSVLNNDRIGSKTGLNASDVLIERTQGQPAPDSHLVMNADGHITVKEGIAIGTYIYYYTIIDKSNNNQTSSAKATIKVVSFVAQQDEYSMTNTKDREQKTPSVITNDEMDGKKPPVIGTDVTLTPGTPSHPNLHMNPDGTITIAPNTPDGVYTYDYTICRVSNPTDCKTTQAIINLHSSLVANDDDYSAHPVNVIHQSIVVGNVLDNDTLGGTPITDPTKVTITLIDNDGLSGVSFASNGEITIPQGANVGTYRVRYNLCMAQQLSVCDDAVVTIVITKDKPLIIYNGISTNEDGKNDGFRIEGIENYRKNTLKIFNRWGVLVYQKEGYTNADPFTGYSNGRSTIESGKKLPQGTYYYILEYENSNNQTQTKSGWLYLKRD
ncbi:gliding motility-associated C-terminal domain-containing protein [Capnocytophaga gingivalis]|uniref:T9SS type B sorting domain-containing protein n=1 Tax=Capnocytophaga gingivalis TaxID=1017 RepID=UPI0028E3A439|nr:gliding motility-associated C-terminal domain-containing protein [Capnocytophaga gingivalis]